MLRHRLALNQSEKKTFIMAEQIINPCDLAGQLGALLERTCGNAGEGFRASGKDVQDIFLSACRDIAHRLATALAENTMAAPT